MRPIASSASNSVPTTICPNRSSRANCWRDLRAILRRRGTRDAAGRRCVSVAWRSIARRAHLRVDGECADRHQLPVRPARRAGAERRSRAVARDVDGPGQGRAARSVRPLDRRAHLAHPRRDRGRSEKRRDASSPCAAPVMSSPRCRTDVAPLPAFLSRAARQPGRVRAGDSAGLASRRRPGRTRRATRSVYLSRMYCRPPMRLLRISSARCKNSSPAGCAAWYSWARIARRSLASANRSLPRAWRTANRRPRRFDLPDGRSLIASVPIGIGHPAYFPAVDPERARRRGRRRRVSDRAPPDQAPGAPAARRRIARRRRPVGARRRSRATMKSRSWRKASIAPPTASRRWSARTRRCSPMPRTNCARRWRASAWRSN